MLWIIFVLSVFGIIVSSFFASKVDAFLPQIWPWIKKHLFEQTREISPDIFVVARVQSQIRGGKSLDSALESLLEEPALPKATKDELRCILENKPKNDFLSDFFSTALEIGTPILDSLSLIHKNLITKQKLKLKALACTSQGRAQAEVLTWLPWSLLLALAVMDWEWASLAVSSPISWLIWSIAILLTGFGKKWIHHQIKVATMPMNKIDKLLEEELPDLTMRVLSFVSAGIDPLTALERTLTSINNIELNSYFATNTRKHLPLEILHIRSIIFSQNGSPIRAELLDLLDTLQITHESKWEERVQKLPVLCLAPLFCCFFPACILVLLSLVLPMISDLL